MQSFDGGDDLSVGDGFNPNTDLAILDGGIEPGCPRPQLFVGVENLNQSSSAPGRVLRFSLAANGDTTPCSTLTAQGTLPPQPMAVAFIPPDAVAAATRDGLWVIGLDDVARYTRAGSDLPIDVFPLIAGNGEQLVAVGYWNGASSEPVIDRVEALRDASPPVYTWQTNSVGFPLSFGVRSMTHSPLDPGRILALENASVTSPQAAADVDPFANSKNGYVAYPAGRDLRSIYSIVTAGLRRTVWVSADLNAIFYVRDQGGGIPLSGPIKCVNRTCNLIHAVPDPTDPVRFLALCETPASVVRDVVRFSSTGGACDIIYTGTNAGANTRLSRLAIAMP
jgi:hypothetical protein